MPAFAREAREQVRPPDPCHKLLPLRAFDGECADAVDSQAGRSPRCSCAEGCLRDERPGGGPRSMMGAMPCHQIGNPCPEPSSHRTWPPGAMPPAVRKLATRAVAATEVRRAKSFTAVKFGLYDGRAPAPVSAAMDQKSAGHLEAAGRPCRWPRDVTDGQSLDGREME